MARATRSQTVGAVLLTEMPLLAISGALSWSNPRRPITRLLHWREMWAVEVGGRAWMIF
jgi:hypothetical protein